MRCPSNPKPSLSIPLAPKSHGRNLVGLLIPLAIASAVSATGPPTPSEFKISSAIHEVQTKARAAADADGNFVVVWEAGFSADVDGDSYGILGRRFSSSGAPIGDSFVVNDYTTSLQVFPDIVMKPSGEFVVIWQSAYHDDNGFDVYARRFDSLANPLGPDLEVNPSTDGDQHDASVSLAADGGFLVIWDHDNGAEHEIRAQRFDASGNHAGGEQTVSAPASEDDFDPRAELRPDGSWITVWERTEGDGSGKSVFARFLSSDGMPTGDEFAVNQYTKWDQENPEVAVSSDGSFAVVWQSQLLEDSEDGILFRVYSSDGSPNTDELQVNITTLGRQVHPMISASSDGFVIVWDSDFGSPEEGFAIHGRRFSSDGQEQGGEFQVNEIAAGDQYYVDIASTAEDRYIVVWTSDDCTGCNNEVEGGLLDLNAIFINGFESGDATAWTWTTP